MCIVEVLAVLLDEGREEPHRLKRGAEVEDEPRGELGAAGRDDGRLRDRGAVLQRDRYDDTLAVMCERRRIEEVDRARVIVEAHDEALQKVEAEDAVDG